MKKILILSLVIITGLGAVAQTGKNKLHHGIHGPISKKTYTCPMHPEVLRNKPGKCPKCGMTLVPVRSKIKKS